MENGLMTYGFVALACTLIIINDLRKRVFSKEDILYRIKDTRRSRIIFFILGLTLPVVIIMAGFTLEYTSETRFLILIMGIEMMVLWALIQLGDTLITKTHAGKVWYTRFSLTEYYFVLEQKGEVYLVFKKIKAKRQEMMKINASDRSAVEEILRSIGIKKLK